MPPLPIYHRHFRGSVVLCCGFFPLQSRVDSFHSEAQSHRLLLLCQALTMATATAMDDVANTAADTTAYISELIPQLIPSL